MLKPPRARTLRVLYSFPHKLGAERICYTAWQQVDGIARAGASVLAFPGVLHKALPPQVVVRPTLARGKIRIPYKLFGRMRALALHDFIVSRRLEKLAGEIDIVHVWPSAAERTLKTAARLGIPTVLERPNAHTRFAYEVVQKECERIGMALPPEHEHAFHADILKKEEDEFELAYRLLCPSEFVASTFLSRGFPNEKLARSQYGYDEQIYHPIAEASEPKKGLTFLFAGGCAPRKGLHFALDAWLQSSASADGMFLIAGAFVPQYQEVLARQLAHPSVKMLGHRRDIPELMRKSDVLVLPSLEEGSALVTYEARGSGCVLLVSNAAGAVAQHMTDSLVHEAGDVATLTQHMNLIHQDRSFLAKLRQSSLLTAKDITWAASGRKLVEVYETIIADHRSARAK